MLLTSMDSILANLIVVFHISYFLFVVGGNVAILAHPRGWKWVDRMWFRLLHIAAVCIVVFEDVFHFECPLNTVEWKLRSDIPSAGSSVEATTGIGGFLDFLLRHTIPGSVLHVFYWAAAVFVVVSLFGQLRRRHRDVL